MIVERKAALETALEAVKAHCMCSRFEESADHYLVYFPAGDFEVGGVRASKGMGKIKALETMLEKMEFYWMKSYPGA